MAGRAADSPPPRAKVPMSDVDKTLRWLDQQGDVTFLFWIFGATVALILLFLIARIFKNVASGKVRQVESLGMDFDAVSGMIDKGLLTPEEAKRVKSVLARHFQGLYTKKSAPPPDLTAEIEIAEMQSPARIGGARQEQSPAKAQPPATRVPPRAKPEPPRPPVREEAKAKPPPEIELPLDVLDMHKAGMISDEELDALRRFYAARAQNAG